MNLSLNSSQTIAVVAIAGALLAGAYAVGRSSGTEAPAAPVVATAPEAAKPEPVSEPAPAQKTELPAEAPATPKPAAKPATPAAKPAAKPAAHQATEAVAEAKPAAPVVEVQSKPLPAKPALCADCLRVLAVRSEERKGEGSGLGAIGGAVVGGLLGNQVGGGSGKKLATLGGAVAGGFAGNELEKRHKTQRVWIVKLEREDGRTLSHEQASDPGLTVGDVAVLRDGELRRH